MPAILFQGFFHQLLVCGHCSWRTRTSIRHRASVRSMIWLPSTTSGILTKVSCLPFLVGCLSCAFCSEPRTKQRLIDDNLCLNVLVPRACMQKLPNWVHYVLLMLQTIWCANKRQTLAPTFGQRRYHPFLYRSGLHLRSVKSHLPPSLLAAFFGPFSWGVSQVQPLAPMTVYHKNPCPLQGQWKVAHQTLVWWLCPWHSHNPASHQSLSIGTDFDDLLATLGWTIFSGHRKAKEPACKTRAVQTGHNLQSHSLPLHAAIAIQTDKLPLDCMAKDGNCRPLEPSSLHGPQDLKEPWKVELDAWVLIGGCDGNVPQLKLWL